MILNLTKNKKTKIDNSFCDLLKNNPILNNIKWFVRYDGVNYYAEASVKLHRLLINAKLGDIVDHINGDSLDNRIKNLRIVTSSQNNANRKAKKNGHSKYLGVSVQYFKTKNGIRKRYIAAIKKNYKRIHLGSFKNEEDAALAYNNKAIELHKEYANLNKIK